MKKLNSIIFFVLILWHAKSFGQTCLGDTIYNYKMEHIGSVNYQKVKGVSRQITQYSNNNLNLENTLQVYYPHIGKFRNYYRTIAQMHPIYKKIYTFLNYQIFDTLSETWINGDKTERSVNSKGKTLNQAYFVWNKTTQSWSQRSNFTNVYIQDTLLIESTSQNYIPHLNSLRFYEKYTYTYNANGNQLTEIMHEWDTVTNSFTPINKHTLTYDAFQNKTSELRQIWNKTLSIYENYSFEEYLYTITQKLNIRTFKIWDGVTYIDNYREINMYNTEDLVSVFLVQNFNTTTSNWVDNYKYLHEYDANKNMTIRITEDFDVPTMAFIPSYKETFNYNSQKKVTKSYYYRWLADVTDWQERGLSINGYNDAGDTLLNHEYYERNEAINSLEIKSKETYQYQNYNPIYTQVRYRSYNSAGGYFDDVTSSEILCKLKNLRIDNLSNINLKLYPNPISNGFLNIEINDSTPIEIFDLNNTLLMKEVAIPNQKINVSSLIPGIYFLKINNQVTKLIIN